MESLHVDGVLFGNATLNRRLIKLLACTKFFHYAGFFKLSLKLLQCSLDVLTIFNWYYNHTFCFYFLVIIFSILIVAAKLLILLFPGKFFFDYFPFEREMVAL
jgi:hypothetical protein